MNPAADEGRALMERVERMERKTRWLTALVVVLALLCVALLAWQFAPLDSLVEARGFVLRDAAFRARAELKLGRDGSPALRLYHQAGGTAAVLQARDDGTVALRLVDAAGQDRAELRLDERGAPALALSGANGRTRIALTAEEADEAGEPRIVLRDRSGRAVWSAPGPAAAFR